MFTSYTVSSFLTKCYDTISPKISTLIQQGTINLKELIHTNKHVSTVKNDPVEIIADDLVRLHTIFSRLETGWNQAESIDEICKLSLTTVKVMEFRRKVVGLDNVNNSKFLSPYDD